MAASKILQVSTSNFNQVPKFCCAEKDFREKNAEKAIENLGVLFSQHAVHDRYGLFMNHRHFNLKEGEILVETLNAKGNVSLALPWTVLQDGTPIPPTDNPRWEEFGLTMTYDEKVMPQTWRFGENGTLIPYEYIITRDELVEPPSEFAFQLFCQLKELGLEGVVGIKCLGEPGSPNSYEVNPREERVSISGLGSFPPGDWDMDGEMYRVLWYFTSEGKMKCLSTCSSQCSYCGSCNRR